MTIGVLAIQGAFIEHENILHKLNIDCFEIRQKSDLNKKFDGLILVGGESTVQGKLLKELNMFDILKDKISNGLPVLGTCAGLILLAENLSNDKNTYFATLPVTVKRNAYGRQLGSFYTESNFANLKNIPMTFIRAPYIESINNNEVEILSIVNQNIVGVKYKNQIGISFHPELNNDLRIHKIFLDLCNNYKNLN